MVKYQYILIVTALMAACSNQTFSSKNSGSPKEETKQTPPDNSTANDTLDANNETGTTETPPTTVDEANKVYKYICKSIKTATLSTLSATELANLPADAKRFEFEFTSYSSVGVQTSDLSLIFNQQQTGIMFLKENPTGGNKGDIVAPMAKVGSNVAILTNPQGASPEKNINVTFIAAYQTDNPCPAGYVTEAIQ